MEKANIPKISVLMAVFNAEKFIRRSVESVLSQTFQDFELICVDDGSQDNSLVVLRELAEQDSRVKIVANQHKGACETLNSCLDSAIGEFVTFIDNDDAYHPRLLELAYREISTSDNDIVIWDWDGVNDEGKTIPFHEIYDIQKAENIGDPVEWSIDNRHVSFWCKIYRRELLSDIRFNPKVIHGDVVFQWELLLKKDLKVGYLPCSLYRYYIRSESMDHCSMTYAKAVDRVICVESMMASCGKSKKITKQVKKLFAEMVWSAYKNGRVFPEFRRGIICEISRCICSGAVCLRDFPFVRRIKIILSILLLLRR